MVQVTPILYLKEHKMQPGVGNSCRILLGCGRRLHTKLCAHKLCKQHRIVLRQFLTWNHRSSCNGCAWVESDSIGATPNRHPSLKVFGLAQLAGLPLISQSHGGGFIFHGLLSMSTADLHSHTTGGLNPFWKC